MDDFAETVAKLVKCQFILDSVGIEDTTAEKVTQTVVTEEKICLIGKTAKK